MSEMSNFKIGRRFVVSSWAPNSHVRHFTWTREINGKTFHFRKVTRRHMVQFVVHEMTKLEPGAAIHILRFKR